MRLGLCCQFYESSIRFRTTTARHVANLTKKGENPLQYIGHIVRSNLESLLLSVDYCADHGIGAFRILSGLLPIYTHPDWGYCLNDLPDSKNILDAFQAVKQRASERKIRFTFHPDQFVVLNSPKEDVVEKSLSDLEYHSLMAKLLGGDVINIHGGGGYGDKVAALKRFAENFHRLSTDVRDLLTVENDDRVFTPEELLPVCHELNIPLVYDVHHHRCLPDRLTIRQATEKALKTWDREPLFHISSPKEGWGSPNPRLHADLISMEDVPTEWIDIDPLTIDVEAKAKEVAVLQLRDQLRQKGCSIEPHREDWER